ncbi:hemerythrin domain-containing protein [Geotalea sp. SG265]|uniref:hemerythrin domain-containing protein n=1 Tax=Geotalea sp. SG265 TaxID=2922867 RepID=UPI001FAF301D|nr:hemerythrin domain-containing protein [Geotalea sp. SG265]
MKRDITKALVTEHKLILRMLAVLEKNAEATVSGTFADYGFFLTGVDFIRNYADRYHHAKEEDVLFEALVQNGMPRENSPVAAMLMEHDLGRAHVKAMEEAALAALAGETRRERDIADNALAYVALLRDHIAKEDTILYPLAERLIPEEARDGIIAGYEAAEARTAAGFAAKYQELVAACEREVLLKAA